MPSASDWFDKFLPGIMRCRLDDLVLETPVQGLPALSARLGVDIRVKREDLQPVFSFKLRGAYAKLQALSDADRVRGVICASAGNHAQGVALAARHLGISAVVVMPAVTPEIKVDAVRKLDARVVIHGDDFEAACAHATEIAAAEDLTFIHPYDDPDVITGQGTIALELFRQCDAPPDYLFICVGGGGLAAGMALVARYLQPGIRIIGVEAEESASMKAAFEAGHPVTLERVGHFAEGVAVRRTGEKDYVPLKGRQLLTAVPYAVMFLSTTWLVAILVFIIPACTANVYLAPVLAQAQGLVSLRMRAVTSAIALLIINVIGLLFGPQVTGILSTLLEPQFGEEAIRYSLLIVTSVCLPWAAWHYFRAGRTIDDDLAKAWEND